MSEANILIVGAGPVGLACALELARRGHVPRIIDKGEGFTPPEQSRALGVNNRTLQLMGPSGVADRLLAEGNRITHIRVINEKGRSVLRFDFENARALYPFMLAVPQGRTERILAEALSAYGVEVEWNAEAIDWNGDRMQPSVDINRPGGVDTIRADMLIGCDGAGSFVRRAAGFSFEGEGYPAEFGLADIELGEDFDASELVLKFQKQGALGCIPIGGRLMRFVSPVSNISDALPADLAVADVVWRSTFRISFRHVETMCDGMVFLAGDAAHVHSPAGARGMNLGIEDACWLACAISEGKTNRYTEQRLPAIRKVIEQTKAQTAMLLGANMWERFARDHLAKRLMAIPAFKRAALKRLTGLDTADPPWL